MKNSINLCLLLALLLTITTKAQLQEIKINLNALSTNLTYAPSGEGINPSTALKINLPYIDGSGLPCYVIRNSIMSDRLQAQFPDINTYAFRSVENPEIFGRITISPNGFYCTYFTGGTLISISPIDQNEPILHQIEIGVQIDSGFACGTTDDENGNRLPPDIGPSTLGDNPLSLTDNEGNVIKRTYDLVVGTTGQFTVANGGTIGSANAVITQTINILDALYKKELAAGLNLVDVCIETDPNNDPFVPIDEDNRTLQAQEYISNCTQITYDVGHVFHNHNLEDNGSTENWSTGGIALLGAVCANCFNVGEVCRGAGWSGSFNNTTNGWYLLTAHEFGHQFGASHTWNGNGADNCNDNTYSMQNSVEIASGTTIMSYAGLCDAPWNVEESEQGYFNGWSLAQMTDLINNRDCQTESITNNQAPLADANPCNINSITIPKATAFKLTGSALDIDDDQLLFAWEQIDNGGGDGTTKGATLSQQGMDGITAGNSDDAPLFRSYFPSANPTRYFPNLQDYLQNVNSLGTEFEALPQVVRDINFTLTIRDCDDEIGGVAQDNLTISVVNVGPLVVNDVCAGGSLTAGNNFNLTWNTNGSDNLCSNVDILMSVDGGITFNYNLAENIAYSTQSANLNLPAGVVATNEARFMLICSDNPCTAFFAINESNCEISSDCESFKSIICNDDAIEVPSASQLLNLSLNFFTVENLPRTTFPTGSNKAITINNSTNDGCYEGITIPAVSFDFLVKENAVYTIAIDQPFDGYSFGSIFSESIACNNFISSTGIDNSAAGMNNVTIANSQMQAELSSCSIYNFTGWNYSGNQVTVEFISGEAYLLIDSSTIGYEYTYAAINQTNNQIELINSNSDFTNLTQGCYNIFGLSFEENEDPNTFIGSTINEVLLSGSCVAFSENFKPVCVTGDVVVGCTDIDACNFDTTAEVNDGSCTYPPENFDCNGNCLVTVDCAGVCGGNALLDCENICEGTATEGTTCTNNEGNTGMFDDQCNCIVDPIMGCTDMDACNFDTTAEVNDGSCTYPPENFDCNGNCLVTVDCAGVCGGNALLDCENICEGTATEGAPCDDGNASTQNDMYDANCDCVGDPIQTIGCTDNSACNYNSNAIIDDGSCLLPGASCNDNNNCTLNDILQADCSCLGILIDENQNNICDLSEDSTVTSVPTMSEWGLFILSLLLLNLVFVRVMVNQQYFVNSKNETIPYFNWFNLSSYPFDIHVFLKALKTCVLLLPLMLLLIILFYQELVWADCFGLSITIPLLSYLMHLFMMNNQK